MLYKPSVQSKIDFLSFLPLEKFVFLYGGYDAAYKRYHEIFKADFNFICKICNYIEEHGNKEDKKWIENLVWDKLIPVYKNQDVDKELVEHLIAQVTDCMTFKVDDK